MCIQQTCLDLLERGMSVHVLVDGVSSQRVLDRTVALEVRARCPPRSCMRGLLTSHDACSHACSACGKAARS